MLSRRAVLASALSQPGFRCFGSAALWLRLFKPRLRVPRLSATGFRVVLGVAACGSAASAVTSALTIRPSRRRFAARLNSGVRPGEKLSSVVSLAGASRSALLAFCWVGVSQWFARSNSRFGRIASDSAGAPPPNDWVDLRVRARMLSHRAVLAGAPLPAGVLASAGRRVRFGLTNLGLRVARLPVSGSRVMRGVAACGSRASAVTSALTIRPSRRRFAARLNSGVRPGEKLSSAVGVGRCIAPCVSCVLLGRRWAVVRALFLSLRTHRFGQRRCTAAKRMS